MLLDFYTQHRRLPISSLFPHPCRSSAAPMMARLQMTSGESRLLFPGACPTWKLPKWGFSIPAECVFFRFNFILGVPVKMLAWDHGLACVCLNVARIGLSC